MTDWTAVYQQLGTVYNDTEIGELAGGLSRNIVNQVRNGTYKFKHDPGFEAGKKLLAAVEELENSKTMPLEGV